MPTGQGPELIANCKREYATLLRDRTTHESVWQLIADLMLPHASDIQTRRTAGTVRTQRLLDGTAMEAGQLLIGHINGGVTNFLARWFGLRMAHPQLAEDQDARVWTDACAERMAAQLAGSTVPQSIHEMYASYVFFGTGAHFLDEQPRLAERPRAGFRGFMAKALSIGAYVIAENASGSVETVYRELELTPVQALEQFGMEALHASVQDKLRDAQERYRAQVYLHAVYPRPYGQGRGQRNMPYASLYLDVANDHLVQEGGYEWFPFTVLRWAKLRGPSAWGYGPGHLALPDTLTLNAIDADILRALPLWIQPPFWTDDATAVGRVSLLPGAVNALSRGSSITPMQAGGHPDVAKLGVEERRQRIRRIFFVDQLQVLPDPDASRMTAYEVSQRLGLMQRLLGPAFTRLLSEFLNPFLDAVFGIMLKAGELPSPPPVVIDAAAQGFGRIDVDYEGPLARAQRGDEGEALDGTLAFANAIIESTGSRDILLNFDLDEMARRKAKLLGVPPSVMRDKAVVAKEKQAQQQAAAQAHQAEQLRQDAAAVGAAAPAVTALQHLAGQGAGSGG